MDVPVELRQLIVGAEKDNTVPASLARKQYEKYWLEVVLDVAPVEAKGAPA